MRILIAEDLWVLADALGMVLEQAGASIVGPVGTLRSAEQHARDDTLDAVVMDIDLHGQKSTSLANSLADAGRKVIVITGFDEPLELSAHIHACFTKPVRYSQLIDSLVKPLRR